MRDAIQIEEAKDFFDDFLRSPAVGGHPVFRQLIVGQSLVVKLAETFGIAEERRVAEVVFIGI